MQQDTQTNRHTYTLIDLPRVNDPRGNLSFIQGGGALPFEIARAYWIYDVPGEKTRGGHALRHTDELVVALSGSFDIILDNGDGVRHRLHLCRSYKGVIVPRMHWREIVELSTNAVVMVLASTVYDAADYINDYDQFVKQAQAQTQP